MTNGIVTSGSIIKMDLKDKYVFWDIDGTLAPYRFNDHVADPDGSMNSLSLKEIENGVFLYRKPSKHMQKVLKTCESKQNIVVGYCLAKKEMQDKEIWLDENYPMISERLFLSRDKSKTTAILKYCNENNINLKDVIFVDDVIPFLMEAEREGIRSFHISSFLYWEYSMLQSRPLRTTALAMLPPKHYLTTNITALAKS